MKLRIVGTALVLLATGSSLGTAQTPGSTQIVDELIAKNIQAHGGLDKLKAITSLQTTGKFMQQGMEFPFTMTQKRPGSFRMESKFQGQSFIMAYNGAIGWSINPFQGGSSDPQKMSDEQLNEMKDQANIDGPLVDYKAKGNTIEYIGKEDLEGTPVQKLKITEKDGDVKYWYLDAESGIELKQTAIVKQDNKEIEGDTYFSDFKEVAGVMMAHTTETRFQGQSTGQMVFDKIEVNVPVDASIFEMPATASKETPKTPVSSTQETSKKKHK
jgi:hypothetical protein